ncbi:MAG: response regulator, partial [Rhodospirillales bacterium]|nr:response regulator [Rhodospirillales bacterium]
AEASTTRQFGGTGLGLVIIDNLTRLMNGVVEVDSTPGEGTTFTVTLPFVEAEGEEEDLDASGLVLFGLTDAETRHDIFESYVEHFGSKIRFAADEAELASWVSASGSEMFILLGMETMAENERVRAALPDGRGLIRFLSLTTDRSEAAACELPNCYTLQRFPLLPSDLRRGLAVLAGRAGTDVETPADEPMETEQISGVEKSRLILLVEDNETNQDVISMQIGLLGHGVEIASNGAEGLEMWKTGRFDLVLADCHMPEMDGFEMTGAIRKIETESGSARTPTIAITANALQGEAERCIASGMDAYLSKPVELVRLRQTMNQWLPLDIADGVEAG